MSASFRSRQRWIPWALGLALAGLVVSLYLWMGKRGDAPLVCGVFGGCVSVNASPYSELFGIPVASLGSAMYLFLTVLAAAHAAGGGQRRSSPYLTLAGFAVALAGALFSLYLTAIEAFVLHAYCIWCLVSFAIISTLAVLWAKGLSERSREVEQG